jgi:trans-2-enoyl-CoA reductase
MKVEIKFEKSRRRKEYRHNKGLEACDIDTEEFSKAVQDLGLEVIDAGIDAPIDIIPVRKEPVKRFHRFNLTASAKRALSSMVNRREKKTRKIQITLDDFPQVPDHEIAL